MSCICASGSALARADRRSGYPVRVRAARSAVIDCARHADVDQGRAMFIAVRKYRVRRGSTAEWAQRVRDSFVPLMRELAGFRGYYLLDGGPDELIAISLF